MGIIATSLVRRLRAFPKSPRKIQKLRSSIRDLAWWARTVRSRWDLGGFKGPIIAITGTKGKTTTTRLISRIFKDAGYRVGTASSSGVYVNDACVHPGSYGGADGPLVAFRAGGTDVLVMETNHGSIQRYGFGFPRCDVAIFTNITDGHVGELGIESLEEMLALKWRLASMVRPGGTIVLNADDPLLISVSPRRTARVAYISVKTGSMPPTADPGGTLYRYTNGAVVKEVDGRSSTVAELRDASMLFGGLISYNAYNLLAAIASTEAVCPPLSVPQESLVRSLLTFGADADDNPGRFNLFELPGGRVVLLAGSNRDSYRRDAEVLAFIKERRPFPVKRIVGVITGIGSQPNDYVRNLARIASSACDEIIVREPQPRYRRGRLPGEISSILAAGARDAGLPESCIRLAGASFDLVQDLTLVSGEPARFVAVFSAFAQEPIVPLCQRLTDLANRTHPRRA